MDVPTGEELGAPFDTPSVARMYDYRLGGFHHFAVDRQVAEELVALYPALPQVARANRAALRRVVTFLAEQGIDQFLDIGSGIPTVGNVHAVAQRRCRGTQQSARKRKEGIAERYCLSVYID